MEAGVATPGNRQKKCIFPLCLAFSLSAYQSGKVGVSDWLSVGGEREREREENGGVLVASFAYSIKSETVDGGGKRFGCLLF